MNTSAVRAIVTGGASGLGLATATRIAAAGGKVVIADVNQAQGDTAAAELGPNAVFVPTDVTNEQQVAAALDAFESAFDGAPINTAVNCAGVAFGARMLHPKKGPHNFDLFKKTMDINVNGTFNVLRLAGERIAGNEPDEEKEEGLR
eukprot:UC1_evm1s886